MAAIADARRNEMTDVYAAVREAAKERQRESPGRPKKGQEQIPEVIEENEWPISQLGVLSQTDKTPAPQTRDTRAKAAGTNAKYIDLANKDDLAKIGAAKRVESGKETGRGNKKVLSQNDKTFEYPKHNTQAAIAKAANTSTGMIGMAHRLKASRTFYR